MAFDATQIPPLNVISTITLDGYLPDTSFLGKAVCVAECPITANIAISCLSDSVNCQGGTFTPTYTAFPLEYYCIPSDVGNNINLESIFNFDAF